MAERTTLTIHERILGQLWLYVDWRRCTKQLTLEEKNAWADAVDAWRADLEGEPQEPIERWWTPTPALVGIAEAAEIIGVSRQRVSAMTASARFPAPIARLSCGPIWQRNEIEAFAATDRPPGRPPLSSPNE